MGVSFLGTKKENRKFLEIALQHSLVPKFRLLSKEEAEEVLKKLKATPNQLPRILTKDPVVRFLRAKPGDIIEFTRQSKTAGITKAYRIVSEV